MGEASGRTEMERRLIERSLQDESFRQSLVEDPKGTVERELGTRLPEDVRVVPWRRLKTPSTWCFPAPRWRAVRAWSFRTRNSSRWRAEAPGERIPVKRLVGIAPHTVLGTSSAHLADKAAAYPRIRRSRWGEGFRGLLRSGR